MVRVGGEQGGACVEADTVCSSNIQQSQHRAQMSKRRENASRQLGLRRTM